MVVGKRHILDEDLANDADARLAERLVQRERVEILDDLAAEAAVVPPGVTAGERGDAAIAPLGVQGVRAAGDLFIRPYAVQAAHEQVAVDERAERIHQQAGGGAEARILFHAVGIDGDDGDVAEPGLFQRAANEADIVAGAAAAAGLRHGDGEMICVVFSGQNGAHDLADDRDGGEAGVVIDVFQARVDGAAVVVAENFDVIAVFAERRAEQIEVDGGHLRREDGPVLVKTARS